MSDNINNIIAQPIGIDVLSQLGKWQALQKAQQDTALTQQQVIGAQQANQLQGLKLGVRSAVIAPFLNAARQMQPGAAGQIGGVPPGASAAGPGSSAATAPATPSGLGVMPTGATQSAPMPAPGAMPLSAAAASNGMPPPGQPIGQPVGPYKAFQTAYGVPIPYGQAGAVLQSDDWNKSLKDAMEVRRSRVFELMSQPDWKEGVTQAYQEGWIDPQHYQLLIDHPEKRNAILFGLASPDAYMAALENYSKQGMALNANGQQVPSPVAIAAHGAMAESNAGGAARGALPYVKATARAQALGAAGSDTVHVPVPSLDANGKPIMGPDGQPLMHDEIVNKAALADSTLAAQPGIGGIAPPSTPAGGLPQNGGGLVAPGAPPYTGNNAAARALTAPIPGTAGALPPPAVAPAMGGAPQVPAPSALPPSATPSVASVGGLSTGMPTLSEPQKLALETQKSAALQQSQSNVSDMADYRKGLSDRAASAVTNNAIIDQMRQEALGFDHGSLTDFIQENKKLGGSVMQLFGAKMPESVSQWEDFNKNAGALARSTASQINPQVGVEELRLVQKYLPSATMSSQAFSRIADQTQGLNDYQIAKTQAAANANGNRAQFEANFNKNITPLTFIFNRMRPQDRQELAAGLAQSPAGMKTYERLKAGYTYAMQNGLLPGSQQ